MARQQTWQELMAQKNQEVAILQAKCNELTQQLAGTKQNAVAYAMKAKELSDALDEFEKTIEELSAEKADVNREIQRRVTEITTERDELQEHLQNQDSTFAKFLEKFENCKQELSELQNIEDTLRNDFDNHVKSIETTNLQYAQLRVYRDKELESANLELEAVRRAYEAEMAHLQGQIKVAEAEMRNLESTIASKTKENEELLHMSDQIIAHADTLL